MKNSVLEKIGFGGGCHWCTEAVFQAVKGVDLVEQGYISSLEPDSGFSEAVVVHFDSGIIPLSVLINIHLSTHSSASNHNMRGKYRSAIYTFSRKQQLEAHKILDHIRVHHSDKIVTRVLPFGDFKSSAKEFCNYYDQDPEKPFCQTYITPKLKFLKANFTEDLKK